MRSASRAPSRAWGDRDDSPVAREARRVAEQAFNEAEREVVACLWRNLAQKNTTLRANSIACWRAGSRTSRDSSARRDTTTFCRVLRGAVADAQWGAVGKLQVNRSMAAVGISMLCSLCIEGAIVHV